MASVHLSAIIEKKPARGLPSAQEQIETAQRAPQRFGPELEVVDSLRVPSLKGSIKPVAWGAPEYGYGC